jgi:hypothetical protein
VTITIDPSDPSKVQDILVSVIDVSGDSTALDSHSSSPHCAILNTTSFFDGSYTLLAQATDDNGDSSAASTMITVEFANDILAPPTPEPNALILSFANLSNDDLLIDPMTIEVVANDTSLVRSITVFVIDADGNTSELNTEKMSPYDFPLDPSAFAEGSYTIQAIGVHDSTGVNALAELGVIFTQPVIEPPPEPEPVTCDILHANSASASGNDGNLPENVLDQDLSTRWSSLGLGEHITVNLGSVNDLCGAGIAWFKGDERSNSFIVSVSLDGGSYSEVFDGHSSGTSDNEEFYEFTASAVQFVRVTVNGNTSNDWASIFEIETAGSGPAERPSEEPTPQPTPDPDPDPTPDPEPENESFDIFGISKMLPSGVDGNHWDSSHWDSGSSRNVTGAGDHDPDDPTGWSTFQGRGDMSIDGQGMMTLSGQQPRIYIKAPGGFLNTEVTFYYRRVVDDDTPWGGAIVGARSGENAHNTTNSCNAHTYYARLRHDGYHDFEKESQHPASSGRDRTKIYSSELPYDVWIGVKYIVFNRANSSVELNHYRDQTGGVDGGTWERLGTQTLDAGDWSVSTDSSCGRPDDAIFLEPGVVFIRNTMHSSGKSNYRWFTVREIVPPR